MIKRFLSVCLALLLCFSLSACSKNSKNNYSLTMLDYFDTVITVSGYFSSQDEFNTVSEKIEQKIKYYHRLFDIYNAYSGLNNLKTINDNAGISEIKVDREIIELLTYCKEVFTLTDGKVNICLGPVLKIWHNYREEGKSVPSEYELNSAKELISIENLAINEKNSTVFLLKSGCSIDVGAIAKGYVGNKIKDYAKSVGLENGIINLGGNVLTLGEKPDGSKFNVAVRDPDTADKNIFNVSVNEKSVVTSGDYQRFYEVNGKKYCHIISPQTLFPADNNKSVTVISDDSALADALSTAVFILNYKEGIALAESVADCEVCIIDKNNTVYYSSGFKKYIVE